MLCWYEFNWPNKKCVALFWVVKFSGMKFAALCFQLQVQDFSSYLGEWRQILVSFIFFWMNFFFHCDSLKEEEDFRLLMHEAYTLMKFWFRPWLPTHLAAVTHFCQHVGAHNACFSERVLYLKNQICVAVICSLFCCCSWNSGSWYVCVTFSSPH